MDVLDLILADWCFCKPDGVVLPGVHLDVVLQHAASRAADPALPEDARQDAYELFCVPGKGLPPFLRLLRITGQSAHGEVIHFLRFWHAFHELWHRLRQGGSDDDAPVAEEIAEFRDALLRRFDNGGVTGAWLINELSDVKSMSADAAMWEQLERTLSELVAAGHRGRLLSLGEVSTPLLQWLAEYSADYCHGGRGAMIRCVRDVAGCRQNEACLHLGRNAWDVEDALFSMYAVESRVATPIRRGSHGARAFRDPSAASWSTAGAKIRKLEVECPICMVPYTEGAVRQERAVASKCCAQRAMRSSRTVKASSIARSAELWRNCPKKATLAHASGRGCACRGVSSGGRFAPACRSWVASQQEFLSLTAPLTTKR
eukprot:CAMPEP_0117557012 /NCGR_PEP_ID=MMETSP0784-20121206/52107_1 /TAXON_ID=39447 /ORGANISM="" /LENGTH=372 /DNA_ID=CAMNT_0005354309 /DNA_START=9 /DNA_END=1128 /DNA_ORIENTATION=+